MPGAKRISVLLLSSLMSASGSSRPVACRGFPLCHCSLGRRGEEEEGGAPSRHPHPPSSLIMDTEGPRMAVISDSYATSSAAQRRAFTGLSGHCWPATERHCEASHSIRWCIVCEEWRITGSGRMSRLCHACSFFVRGSTCFSEITR